VEFTARALIKRAKQGDTHAFAELVETYKDKIYCFLYRMTGNREDAYDLAQEVFLRVYNNLHAFDETMRFSPWIYRIAQNLAVDHLRKRRNLLYLDEPTGDDGVMSWQVESSEPGPEAVVEFEDFRGSVAEALNQLSPMYKAVMLLRFVQELPYEDIARTLDLPLTTVKTRLYRAREALRKNLIKQGYFEASQGGTKIGLS